MGNSYALALSKGLKHMVHERVLLSNNRLTPNGSLALIRKLKPAIKQIDLSENVLGPTAARELGEFIKSKAIK